MGVGGEDVFLEYSSIGLSLAAYRYTQLKALNVLL